MKGTKLLIEFMSDWDYSYWGYKMKVECLLVGSSSEWFGRTNSEWCNFWSFFFVELFQSLIFNKLILDFEFSLIEEGLVYLFVRVGSKADDPSGSKQTIRAKADDLLSKRTIFGSNQGSNWALHTSLTEIYTESLNTQTLKHPNP